MVKRRIRMAFLPALCLLLAGCASSPALSNTASSDNTPTATEKETTATEALEKSAPLTEARAEEETVDRSTLAKEQNSNSAPLEREEPAVSTENEKTGVPEKLTEDYPINEEDMEPVIIVGNEVETAGNPVVVNEGMPEADSAQPAQTAAEPLFPSASFPTYPKVTSSAVGYNDRKSWWFSRNQTNTPPTAQQDINIMQYDAYYLGDTDNKVIYLTFDEGYENGYTSQILDTLKEYNIKAAFFVTKSYIESEPELVKRMVEEGHVVGNHSTTHPDMTTKTDEEILWELESCAQAFQEVTGTEMPRFFRPPEGVYSIRTLEKTQQAGYKTIFWSYAYQDWDVNNQPGKQAAYDMAVNNCHNGAIMLLHAVSQSNTEALADIITTYQQNGYTFASLYDLPKYNFGTSKE